MKYNLCILFLFFNSIWHAQSSVKNTDSLYNVVYSDTNFTKKNELLLIQTCNDIYRESVDKGDDETALRSLTTVIRVYNENNETINVLQRIEKGISLARKQSDDYRLGLLYIYLGDAFFSTGFFEKAKNSYATTFKLSSKIKDKDQRHILRLQYYGAMAKIFEASNPSIGQAENTPIKDSILYYVKKAYAEAKMISPKNSERPRWLGERARITGSVLVGNLRFDEAKKYLEEAEVLLSGLSDKRFMIGLYRFQGMLIYNSRVENRLSKTLELYKKCLYLTELYDTPERKYLIADALAELYSEMKMPAEARNFSDVSKRIKYEIDKSYREATPMAGKIELSSLEGAQSFPFFKSAIILFSCASAIYYFLNRAKKRNIRPILEGAAIPISDVLPHTEKIQQLLDLARNDEKSFYIVFKQVFPDFQSKLLEINSELSVSDLELCAYLKLNLQTKEIATYKKNTISSVDNRKSRLRKKLNLSSDTNLYVWIDHI